MRRGRRGLHEQGLGQLALLLLDLLLQVSDCTRDLATDAGSLGGRDAARPPWFISPAFTPGATLLPNLGDPALVKG